MKLRLPFVSRRAYTAQRQQLKTAEKRHAEVLALLTDEHRRTKHLLDTIVALKVGGATLVKELLQDADGNARKLTRRTPSRIQQAIDENPRASSNPGLRRHLVAWAEKEFAKPSELTLEQRVEDIVMRLKTWHVAEMADDEDEDDEGYLEFADGDDEHEEGAEPAATGGRTE